MIRLYDSVRGEVRELTLRDPGQVSMYVCGPTVYDLPHLGHGRYTLIWDVARRWFTFQGLNVRYVSNITDIDDNIIERAIRDGTTEVEVAKVYEDHWWHAMGALGVAYPTDVPHATRFVPEMIELIESLLAIDVAYTRSAHRSTSRCGRTPSPTNPTGGPRSATADRAGTPSAW